MNLKDILIFIIFLFFIVPSFLTIALWSVKATNDPTNISNIDRSVELMAESSIPWWFGIIELLAGLPGIIGSVLIITFLLFLKWIGETK